jgi:hypothetical protein
MGRNEKPPRKAVFLCVIENPVGEVMAEMWRNVFGGGVLSPARKERLVPLSPPSLII